MLVCRNICVYRIHCMQASLSCMYVYMYVLAVCTSACMFKYVCVCTDLCVHRDLCMRVFWQVCIHMEIIHGKVHRCDSINIWCMRGANPPMCSQVVGMYVHRCDSAHMWYNSMRCANPSIYLKSSVCMCMCMYVLPICGATPCVVRIHPCILESSVCMCMYVYVYVFVHVCVYI